MADASKTIISDLEMSRILEQLIPLMKLLNLPEHENMEGLEPIKENVDKVVAVFKQKIWPLSVKLILHSCPEADIGKLCLESLNNPTFDPAEFAKMSLVLRWELEKEHLVSIFGGGTSVFGLGGSSSSTSQSTSFFAQAPANQSSSIFATTSASQPNSVLGIAHPSTTAFWSTPSPFGAASPFSSNPPGPSAAPGESLFGQSSTSGSGTAPSQGILGNPSCPGQGIFSNSSTGSFGATDSAPASGGGAGLFGKPQVQKKELIWPKQL